METPVTRAASSSAQAREPTSGESSQVQAPAARVDWHAIVLRLERGDREALLVLSRLVTSLLRSWGAYALHSDWDDLVQEVVTAMVRGVRDGRLLDPDATIGYVRSTARFKLVDRIRSWQRRGGETVVVWEELIEDDPSTPSVNGDRAGLVDVERALGRLSADRRALVVGVYVEGKTYQEVADQSGIPLGSVKRYLREALLQLREDLGDRLG